MSLKILTCCKKVLDYAIKPRIRPDGKGVFTDGLKHIMNPFDEIALEEAVRLKEKGLTAQVLAVTCGPLKHKDVLQQALALGADSAMHVVVNDPQYDQLQPLAVASLLARVAKSKSIDLVLMGKQAIDDDCNQTGQLLAGLLGWPQATCASKLEVIPEQGLRVERESDGGIQQVQLKLPSVVTADLRLNTPRYVTLPNLMKARSKPIEQSTPEELEVDISPRIEVLECKEPPARQPVQMLNSIDELLKLLEEKGFIKAKS